MPPGLGAHVGAPRLGGVPVVDDLVVVEDHHARYRRQQPPDLRIGPRVEVQPGVLVERHHLFGGGARAAAPPQPAPYRRGRLVGVHLVAQQDERIGCGRVGVRGEPAGVRVQGVRREAAVDLLRRPPAGAEHEPGRRAVPDRAGADHARRVRGVDGPDRPAIQAHLVGRRRTGCQPVDHHQRVVPVIRRERAGHPTGAAGAHFDRCRAGCLYPHGRPVAGDAAQDRAEHELCLRHAS